MGGVGSGGRGGAPQYSAKLEVVLPSVKARHPGSSGLERCLFVLPSGGGILDPTLRLSPYRCHQLYCMVCLLLSLSYLLVGYAGLEPATLTAAATRYMVCLLARSYLLGGYSGPHPANLALPLPPVMVSCCCHDDSFFFPSLPPPVLMSPFYISQTSS